MTTFNGMRVKVTEMATAALSEDRWDWSGYRSPSRAKRRRRRSRVITREPACFQVSGELVIHPRLWDALKRQTQESIDPAASADGRFEATPGKPAERPMLASGKPDQAHG